ncbi:hypothetical protein M1146_00480 [Patescibacteria group bacterium]|nr:hypothetical protein [Patescibacteria group bacterium]
MNNQIERPKRITIPGRSEEVDMSRVHGDIETGIRFEVSGSEKWLGQFPRGKALRDVIEKGGRVFVTEADDFLWMDPPLPTESSS